MNKSQTMALRRRSEFIREDVLSATAPGPVDRVDRPAAFANEFAPTGKPASGGGQGMSAVITDHGHAQGCAGAQAGAEMNRSQTAALRRRSEFIREDIFSATAPAPVDRVDRPAAFANEFAPTGNTNTIQPLAGDRT
ncbi:MAG TPA: hypothetical protein VF682_09645 [Pseudomonas sp.]